MAWFDAHDYFVFEASTEPPPSTERSVGLPADRPRRIDRIISYFGDPIRHVDDMAAPSPSSD
jgi:hypothetical protein